MRWESILLLAVSLFGMLLTLSRSKSPNLIRHPELAKQSLTLVVLLAIWSLSIAFFISLESYGQLNLLHVVLYNLTLSLVLAAAVSPIKKKRHRVSNRYIKALAGIFILIAVFSLILPSFEIYSFIWLGPLFSFILPILLTTVPGNKDAGLSFDGRKYMLRAAAYATSIAVLVGLYTLLLYLFILPIIQPGASLDLETVLLILFGTMATILLYGKIKNIFDSVTDKIFFRRNYTLTELLEELDQEMIDGNEVKEIALSLKKVLQKYFKTEFVILEITHGKFSLSIDSRDGKVRKELGTDLAKRLRSYYETSGSRVVSEEILDSSQFKELHNELQSNHYSVALDLGDKSSKNGRKDYRMLLLGKKKNGESYTKQELRSLSIIAKELVLTLQGAMRFEEIKQLNVELEERIRAATKQLRRQNKELIRADEFKDDFLSIASHQMRTPISTISGYASMLRDGDAGSLNLNQRNFVETIEENAKRLSNLINDFLTASRLNSGKFEINRNNTDFAKILEQELLSVGTRARAKGIKLDSHIESNVGKIWVDGPRLRQVVINMLDNAACYTPRGGEISVEMSTKDGKLKFRVKDNGVGIPKLEQSRLFSKMFRATNAKAVRPDGTGLGLYLARKIVLGHGGYVIFNSEEGKGSTFGFNIPIDQ